MGTKATMVVVYHSLAESSAATLIPGPSTIGPVLEHSTCLFVCSASPEAEWAQCWSHSVILRPWSYYSVVLGRLLGWQHPLSIGHQFFKKNVNNSNPFQLTEARCARALDLVAEVWGVLEGIVRLD